MHFLTVSIIGPRGKPLSPGDFDYVTPGVISQDVRTNRIKGSRGGKIKGLPRVSHTLIVADASPRKRSDAAGPQAPLCKIESIHARRGHRHDQQ